MFREKVKKVASGYPMLVILLLLQLATIYWIVTALRNYAIAAVIGGIIAAIVVLVLWIGFFMVNPNEAKVLQLFGKYIGTAKDPGLRWANPFLAKRAVSLRVRNFESGKLKVNDSTGNPIEIAAVVVWKVVDSAEAVFEVDDYEEFVTIQSEAALRNLATTYPYEAHNDGDVALRSDPQQIAGALRSEIQARLEKAGVEVIEARISHLAYAPEIANAMLRRQQASAIIAARTQIVDGAVGMVEMALDKLAEKHVLELDEERKATMVSNLLVVLCSEHDATPVLNTGSLYA
ncbi:MAG: SPFH domain-containing protein [Chromatiales bacterium]|nr:SPFH domain-containing protein [Chromatiales bacterium]MDH3894874.1 SPFH domain-containing protein [Chromatiales bacterium]MDH3931607.1 SPFH domain-containing protein [Chromatiales bacterium]MDH3946619.1 SPFH domain-containing protein [Chromatiales bacterium]